MDNIEYREDFTAIGEAREVNVTVAEGVAAPNQVFVMQWGHLHAVDKDGNPKPAAARYALSRSIIKDGAQVSHTVYGTDPAKLIDNAMMIVYGQMNVPLDQVFSDADLEDEWFAQKLEVVKDDVWAMAEYKDKLGEFSEARGELEDLLEGAENSAVETQDDYLRVSRILVKLREQVGGDLKLLKSVISGGEGAGNMPRLSKLGRGVNALRDALWLAGLSEGELSILPVTITNGKSGGRHASKGLATVGAESYIKEVEFDDFVVGDNEVSLPTAESCGWMLRAIADKFFGVKAAREMSEGEFIHALPEVAALVNEAALSRCSDFNLKYGKHADTYDSGQYASALEAFGAIQCSTAGTRNLFEEAVAVVNEAVASDDYAAKINSALGNRGNLLLRHAAGNARSMIEANEKSADIKEVLSEVDVETVDAVALKAMSPLAKAAYHYKLMSAYADAGDVWAELKALCASNSLANVEPVKAD